MDIVIKRLSRYFLAKNLHCFIDILRDIPNEYWGEEHFLKDLPGKYTYSCYASIDNQLVGYIISTERNNDAIHINKFMVHYEYRGKEIGTKLFSFFEEAAINDKKRNITLKVYKSNEAAVRFYERIGFTKEYESLDNNSNILILMKKIL